jgi:hypothetical protein
LTLHASRQYSVAHKFISIDPKIKRKGEKFIRILDRIFGYELFVAISIHIEPLPVFLSWAEHKIQVRVSLNAHGVGVLALDVLVRGVVSLS